ncbi:peptidylprolyl isomerase [Aliiglaciecola sp. LCG003]|uniref:FKBP-type peptidyl-prolyl cis-trans isomerase n=1 Tax=Aliiglaciecola sp. LCG003 TaxID=3053655 RepID=UPI0025736D1B|nr:peptidylprolyl isomerase [Aliiglaciecola sp. LCG003]WJG10482.1 peptidylprolyl isomerase [Aliiglaciecola sp. LCG003]
MLISENTVVTMHFTVSTTDGTQIDTSKESEPMVFLQGSQYLIKGLEDALEGRQQGDKFELEIAPELAYGERQDTLVQMVPKSMFDGMDLEVGMTFRATTDEGEQSVMIIDETDDEVVVDGNHPLSGVHLKFDVEILDVRAATEEEIAHGHPHGAGGCGHTH